MRRFKHGLLALLAVLALTAAVGAASATAASQFQVRNDATGALEYPATVSGEAATVYFSLGYWGKFQCGSPFAGELQYSSRSLTLSSLACGLSANVNKFSANNCKLTFHPGAATSPGRYGGSFDIGGTGCTAIEVETKSFPVCKLSIPPQTVNAVNIENLSGSPGTMSLEVATEGTNSLTYVNESPSCGSTGTQKGGGMSADWTLKAFRGGNQRTLSTVSVPTGIKHSGSTFTGESYPLAVLGSQGTEWSKLKLKGTPGLAVYSCSTAKFANGLGGATAELPLVPQLSGCADEFFGKPVTVSFNSCQYILVANGTLRVNCSKEGDFIEYAGGGFFGPCAVKIPAQSGVKNVTYTNIGSGDGAGIRANLSINTLATVTTGLASDCGASPGSHSDGVLGGTIELFGSLAV